MAQVSEPRGKSFEDAKLRFEDIQRALLEKSGTVRYQYWGMFDVSSVSCVSSVANNFRLD